MNKIKVLLLMGGGGSEHEVSLSSGEQVLKNFDKEKYEVTQMIMENQNLDLAKVKEIAPDVVFIALHGGVGEDGTIQKMFEDEGIKFIGCGSEASRIGMDKIKFLELVEENGIPLSFLDLKINDYTPISWLKILILAPIKYLTNWKSYDVLILEMGIDSASWPKNMDYLLSIVKPNIGIFLNVSSVHMMCFSSLDQIANEKSKLVNQAKVAIINPHDKLVVKYTTNKNIINLDPTNIKFKNFFLPQVYDIGFGAALVLAKLFNIPQKQAIENIQNNFSLPPSRSSILKGIKDTTIIDSSYNSSPLACQELLKFLSTFKGRKIAVLGDMRELGKSTPFEHRRIYEIATKSADIIISVGPQTKKYFGSKSQKFIYWWQAVDYLKDNIKGGETILVKGSQNTIYLEELVKNILSDPKDSSKLCRQSPWWLKTKQKFQNENQ